MQFEHLNTIIEQIHVSLPAKASATTDDDDGVAIDLLEADQYHSGLVVVHCGDATGTPDSFSVAWTLEHSDDNTNWSTATRADGENATVTQTESGIARIDFFPNQLKRYQRLNRVTTLTGGTSPRVPTFGAVLYGAGRIR